VLEYLAQLLVAAEATAADRNTSSTVLVGPVEEQSGIINRNQRKCQPSELASIS